LLPTLVVSRMLRHQIRSKGKYELDMMLDELGEAHLKALVLALYLAIGLDEEDLARTDSFVEQCENPSQRIAGVASGGSGGSTKRHWHRSALLMANLGEGKKVWRVRDAAGKGPSYNTTLLAPTYQDNGQVEVSALYLPPHWDHDVISMAHSLAVHAYVVPRSQIMACAFWALKQGSQQGNAGLLDHNLPVHITAVQEWGEAFRLQL